MKLRAYQEEAIASMRNYKGRGGLVILPTGAGKSVVVQEISKHYFETLIVAPRKILVNQYKEKYGLPSICYNSLTKEDLNKYDLILFDEAHFCSRGIRWFKDFVADYKGQYFGLTATPFRDNDDMILKDKFFSEIIYSKEVFELTKQGFLSPVNFVDMEEYNDFLIGFSELNSEELGAEGDILCDFLIEIYNKEKQNGVILVFLPLVDISNEIGKRLVQRGYSCKTINSKRKEKIDDIELYDFCLNVDMLTTGFDLPSLKTIVIARNTESINKYFQIIGRGTRIFEGKKQCSVYDCSYKYKGIQEYSTSLKMEECVALINKNLDKCTLKSCKTRFLSKEELYCPKCKNIGKYALELLSQGAVFNEKKDTLLVPPPSLQIASNDIANELCSEHQHKYVWSGRYIKRCPECWFLGATEEKKEDKTIKIIDKEYMDTQEYNAIFNISVKKASFGDGLLQVTFFNKEVIATRVLSSPFSNQSKKDEVSRMLHKIFEMQGVTFFEMLGALDKKEKIRLKPDNFYILTSDIKDRDFKKLLKVYKK